MFRKKNKKVRMFEMDFILVPNNKYAGLKAYLTSCIAICMRVKTPHQTMLGMYHWDGEGAVNIIKEHAEDALDEFHEFMQINAKDYGIKSIYIRIKARTGSPGTGPGARAVVKTLTKSGLRVISIADTTSIPRGGPKKKGGRRGRRV